MRTSDARKRAAERLAEPYTRAAMVSVPAELVEALREALAYDATDPEWYAVRMAARALVDAVSENKGHSDTGRTTAGEGEAQMVTFTDLPVGEPLCKCGQCGHPETAHSFHLNKCLMTDDCACTAFTPALLSPSVRRIRDEGNEAEEAWQSWDAEYHGVHSNPQTLMHDAYIAAYRQSLLDAAATAVYADFGEYHPDGDGTEEIVLGVRESWLRARAARLAGEDDR